MNTVNDVFQVHKGFPIGPTRTEDYCAETRFANALASVRTDAASLKNLILRMRYAGRKQGEKELSRRVHKLAWFIKAGYRLGVEIDSPCLVEFFYDVTKGEMALSDAKFAAEWDDRSAMARRRLRIERGLVSEEGTTKKQRLCAAGSKCKKAFRRQPATADLRFEVLLEGLRRQFPGGSEKSLQGSRCGSGCLDPHKY
jgi:hypothetical protein